MKRSKNWHLRSVEVGFVLATVTSLTTFGCGTEGNGTSTSSSGGGGSGGGGNIVCIDPATYADVLTISDAGFCVVGSYETDSVKGSLTWGRHGGPMFAVRPTPTGGSIDLTRLTAPEMATTGKLTAGTNGVDLGLPMDGFFGAQVIDLPFFNWTLVSFTKADALVSGQIIMFEGNNVLLNYPINGFYGAVATGTDEKDGRFFYSGLSPIFKNASNTNALYAAEPCGTVDNKPRFVSDADPTCKDSFAVEAFGTYSGPIAADSAGNVFVVMSTDTEQEARGYSAESVKRGAATATGTSMFKIPGYAGSLAAVAPDGTGTGVVVFQAQEVDGAMMLQGKDVIAQRFTVEAGVITNKGLAGPMMTPTAKGEVLNFTNDDKGRVWVAVKRGAGYAMLVVARKD